MDPDRDPGGPKTCGSGGSADPDSDPDPQHCKKVRKTLIPTVLRLLCDFLSLKNNVNVASKSNKKKKIFVDILKVTDEKSKTRIRSRIRIR
jgi:hypothetical protein